MGQEEKAGVSVPAGGEEYVSQQLGNSWMCSGVLRSTFKGSRGP